MHAFPGGTSSDQLEEIYGCPSLKVHAVALRPLAASTSASSSRPPPVESFDPTSSDFRPARLSPANLARWRDMILRDMFQDMTSNGSWANRNFIGPTESAFVSDSGGGIKAGRPDHRYPLPLPDPDETTTELVYICQAPTVAGKFDNAKANALKVPNGPIRGKLVRGETVEYDDPDAEGGRRVVRPEDVVGESAPGGVSREQSSPAAESYHSSRS